MKNNLFKVIFLSFLSFFSMLSFNGLAVSATYGKIIYPWNATTAIVKAGDCFDVWFIAEPGQTVYSAVLNGPYNTVHISSDSMSYLSGFWQYDPVSENTYNTQITVTVPANTPEDRYDLILNTSNGEVVSKSSVRVIREYKSNYKIFLIADSHLGQRGTEVLVPNKHTAFVKMANIINPDIVVNAGDVVYYHSDPSRLQERMDLFYYGDESEGWKGMYDFNAPTFVVAGNHDFQEGGVDGLPQEGYYDLKSDYWNKFHGLQYHFFSYGNSRFMLFNNGWHGYDWRWQYDRAANWLDAEGSAGKLNTVIAHISRTEFIDAFAHDNGIGLYLFGHNHHLGDRNPYSVDDRFIMFYARSVRDHFEFLLMQVDDTKGTYTPLGYVNTDPETDGYGLSTGNNMVLENDDEKNNPDASAWNYNLTLDFEHENDGHSSYNSATLVNKFDYTIPDARIRFIMPREAVYAVSKGKIYQTFDGNDYHIVDVDIDLDANSTTVVKIEPENFAPQAARPLVYELSNNNIGLGIDANGHLVSLVNRQTGHSYLVESGQNLWKMYYRTSDAHELEIPADKQSARVVSKDNTLEIIYSSLTGNVPLATSSRHLDISFILRVELKDDQLIWTATIENNETEPGLEISEVWIPWLYGVGDLGKGPEKDQLYWPEDGGRRITDPVHSSTRAWQMTYPWPASMQWYALSNDEESIYVGSHDQSLMTTALSVMAHSNCLSFSMIKYPFVEIGETWTSAPTVIRFFSDTWHEGARFYRAWADTWMPRPDPPGWMHRMNGWIIPNLKAQHGGFYRGVYADLPQYFQDAQAAGIDMVSIYGWVKQGFDNLYPEYDPDPGMGGEEGLKAAIAEIQRGGGKVNLYFQGQLIDPGTEYYRRIGYRQTAKDIWGGEYRETYGGRGSGTLLNIQRNKMFGVACPLAPGWYEQLVSNLEMAKSYGVNGIMYDQIAGRPPYICFDKDHLHSKPSLAFGPGKLQNMLKLRDLIKSHDPDFAFLHELVVDVFTGIGDITQPVGYGFVYNRPGSFGEMFKYTFPDRIITNRTGQGIDRRTEFGYGFALQWRVDGMMRDNTDPEMAAYLSRLNQLRTQFADLLLEGRFVDNEGFKSYNPNVASYAYLAGNRMAITLWNPASTPQRPVIVADGYTLESANWQDPGWEGIEHEILPGDVAVFVFSKI